MSEMADRTTVLLVRPKPPKETIGLQHVMICEPLELEYIAGNLNPKYVKVRIVDLILEKKNIEYFLNKYRPHIVGMTGYITHVGVIKELAKQVKTFDPSIVTAVGGVHAEVNPGDFSCNEIDYTICETPIRTFQEIVRKVHEQRERFARGFDSVSSGNIQVKTVPGTFQAGDTCLGAYFRARLPKRDAVKRYRKKYYYMFHNPCALMKTSFGCPFSCSFCFCKEVTGGKYYARDVMEVVDEIEGITEKEIYIVDDDFLFSPQRLNSFCDELEKRNLKKRFLVYGRADFIARNEEVVKRLAKNGLKAVIVGIESVRESDLEKFHKLSDVGNSDRAIAILQKYKIELYATMILQPDFTVKDFDDLADFLIARNVVFVNLQPLTPLPGTDIFREYEKKILVQREDYAKWDLAHVVLQPKHMSIRRYYYEIIRTYAKVVFRKEAVRHMLSRYGFFPVLRMWWGSQFVTLQYIKKMILGR